MNTDELSDKAIHIAKSGKDLSTGASVPVELGCVTFQCGYVCPPGNSPAPLPLWFLWMLPHMGMINYSSLSSPFSPLWKMWGRAENSNILYMSWSFKWPVLIQESSRNPSRVTSLGKKKKKMLLMLLVLLSIRDFTGIFKSSVKDEIKENFRARNLPSTLIA